MNENGAQNIHVFWFIWQRYDLRQTIFGFSKYEAFVKQNVDESQIDTVSKNTVSSDEY